MPGAEAMTEAEVLFNGGDERAAEALTAENTDLGMVEITARLDQAVRESTKAA